MILRLPSAETAQGKAITGLAGASGWAGLGCEMWPIKAA